MTKVIMVYMVQYSIPLFTNLPNTLLYVSPHLVPKSILPHLSAISAVIYSQLLSMYIITLKINKNTFMGELKEKRGRASSTGTCLYLPRLICIPPPSFAAAWACLHHPELICNCCHSSALFWAVHTPLSLSVTPWDHFESLVLLCTHLESSVPVWAHL